MHLWRPTKFVYSHGKLKASRNSSHVGIGSRLVADLVASLYNKYIPAHARGRLVDLGCGSVPLFQAYRDYVGDVVCVDWQDTPVDHLDFQCDLTQPLPFGDGEFDTVILSDVLEHVPTPTLLWREMARILAPKGAVIMNVPFYYWLHDVPHDYYRYSEYALRRFVRENGLEVVVLETIGGSPEIIADILAKHVSHLPVLGGYLAAAIQTVTFLSLNVRPVRKLSQKTSRGFPFGYFLVAEKANKGT